MASCHASSRAHIAAIRARGASLVACAALHSQEGGLANCLIYKTRHLDGYLAHSSDPKANAFVVVSLL